ncbi:MAG: hypothetical protein RL034_851 [Bacteroidota bacterium]
MEKGQNNSDYHIPVLYHETLNGLHIKPDGIYVDCTFGGGGHSAGILSQLNEKGKLFAFDQDADAQRNVMDDERVVFIPENFSNLQRFLRLHKANQVDGILADLGVSSHQFDQGDRGFSIRFSGPLDMRMDQRQTLSAAEVVRSYAAAQLHKMFEQYGEVTNSKTLAAHIVTARAHVSVTTIEQFKSLIAPVVKGNPNKYLAQVFQALRMEVNNEMGALESMLSQVPDVLKPGGRVAIITFHSIEDRMVKNFFRQGSFVETPSHPFLPDNKEDVFTVITKKPITATEEELKNNTRSRSAKLRVAEKN